ncbi:MerR family transcriptional regulator [Rhodococcus sp. CH91]|uniref:MerR family transcriptional regulator n=1 Tax=Rhodococcus sp. CH91 TaxID=2910256 RepID=UPI001F4AE126|nr:MerR family transcriptional regulator [Rhodococcus sp. CH91]
MGDRFGQMSIGDFARSSRLTVKALRHYEREELLLPARVDPHTGYRYYETTQLATALRIGLLRQAGVSIPAIRRIVADHGSADVLAAERARIEEEAARAARSLELVGSLERVVAAPPPVHLYAVEERTVLWREDSAAADDLDRAVVAAIGALTDRARELGFDTSATVLGRYPAALDGMVDFGVGLELPGSGAPDAGRGGSRIDIAGGSRIGITSMPGGLFAGVDFTGPPSLLPVAYHSVFTFLAAHELEATGPVREYYLDDPGEVGEHAMRTRVVHPVPAGFSPAHGHAQS